MTFSSDSAKPDRIEGLNAGSDYYLPTPFDTWELLACVNGLLWRQGNQVDERTFGNTAINLVYSMLVCVKNLGK